MSPLPPRGWGYRGTSDGKPKMPAGQSPAVEESLAEVIRTAPLRGLRLTERYVGAMTRHILGSSWLAARDAAVAERYERDLAAQNTRIAAVEKLRDNGPFLTRWIDDSRLVDVDDLTRALSVSDPGQDKHLATECPDDCPGVRRG